MNAPTTPTCDECGKPDHEATEWCGNCGCCEEHCQEYEGCPNRCDECHLPFPNHSSGCYHIDCDDDDIAVHRCGLLCLDGHDGDCDGPVEYHTNPYSDSFRAWPRCDKHYRDYADRMQGIAQRYPTNAPSDFDPLYAGERWEED